LKPAPPLLQRKTIHDTNERRARQRFRIGQDVRYKCLSGGRLSDGGAGKSLDVSSGGVRFTTERALSVGELLEVTVKWPALVDNTCLMKLVINGQVIRSDPNSAAVKIERYEFRTRASKAFPVSPDTPSSPEAS
jgi:hypothetical protein